MGYRPRTSLPLDHGAWMSDGGNRSPPKPRDMSHSSAANIFHVGPIPPAPPPIVREVNPLERTTFDRVDPRSVVKPRHHKQADETMDTDDSYLKLKPKILKEHTSTFDTVEVPPPRQRISTLAATTFDKVEPPPVKPKIITQTAESPYNVIQRPPRILPQCDTSFDKEVSRELRQVNTKVLETTYDKDQPVERPHIKLPAINPTYVSTFDKIVPHVPATRITPNYMETYGQQDITEAALPHRWIFQPVHTYSSSTETHHRSPEYKRRIGENVDMDGDALNKTADDINFAHSRSPPMARRMTFGKPKKSLIERPYSSMPELPYYSAAAAAPDVMTPMRKPAVPRFARRNPTAPAATTMVSVAEPVVTPAAPVSMVEG